MEQPKPDPSSLGSEETKPHPPAILHRRRPCSEELCSHELLAGPWIASRLHTMEKHKAATLLVGFPPEASLDLLASFVIKSILFNISVLITSFTFPIWLLYTSLLLATDPLGALKRARDGAKKSLVSVCMAFLERASSKLHQRLEGHHNGVGRVAASLIRGCCWSIYVFLFLCGLLVMAFLAGNMVMRGVVEEPVWMAEDLGFDYTKATPDALVWLGSAPQGVSRGWDYGGMAGVGKQQSRRRLVPPDRTLHLTVSLVLPESNYNRKLGVFQVKAEFLSEEGKVIATSSHPCMLRFKSTTIRFVETFPLVAGHASESQVLSFKMTGFTERVEPTASIRITLQHRARAEFSTGAGIPEIYAASVTLESELPLHKRIIWNWRMTIFIWFSVGFFVMELLVVILCCKPVMLPRTRKKHV